MLVVSVDIEETAPFTSASSWKFPFLEGWSLTVAKPPLWMITSGSAALAARHASFISSAYSSEP